MLTRQYAEWCPLGFILGLLGGEIKKALKDNGLSMLGLNALLKS